MQVTTTGGLSGTDLETTLLCADIYLGSMFWGVDFYSGQKLTVGSSSSAWLAKNKDPSHF